MKIEFDESNPTLVTAIATMLGTIAGVETVVSNSTTTEAPDPTKPPPNDFGEKKANIPPPDLSESKSEDDEDDGLDSDGYPWDARINAKTKTKNADDTWKILRRPKKQFADDESWQAFIAEVRAELKGEPITSDNKTDDEPDMSFAVLMKSVTGSNGVVTTEMLQEICDSYEIEKPTDLAKLENKILLPGIYEEVQEIINGG